MAGKVLEKEYEIHYFEIDYKKKALITSLVDFMCDAATWQSEMLGAGMDYLLDNKILWVMYKWNVSIYQYPRYGETIKIRTWAYSFKKFYACRKFEIIDKNGNKLGEADSIWFLIHAERRRPIRISENLYKVYGLREENDEMLEISEIMEPSRVDNEQYFKVRYSDIDTNRHVNNVKYLGWMIETVPQEIVLQHTLENVKITYEKETRYGDEIQVITEVLHKDNKKICLHKIVDQEGNRLTLGQTEWV